MFSPEGNVRLASGSSPTKRARHVLAAQHMLLPPKGRGTTWCKVERTAPALNSLRQSATFTTKTGSSAGIEGKSTSSHMLFSGSTFVASSARCSDAHSPLSNSSTGKVYVRGSRRSQTYFEAENSPVMTPTSVCAATNGLIKPLLPLLCRVPG